MKSAKIFETVRELCAGYAYNFSPIMDFTYKMGIDEPCFIEEVVELFSEAGFTQELFRAARAFKPEDGVEQVAVRSTYEDLVRLLVRPYLLPNSVDVEYFASTEDVLRNRRSKIGLGRFLTRIFHRAELEVQKSVLQRKCEVGIEPVKFIANDDVEGWGKVYRSAHIKSCMNNADYGVTQLDTYRAYCTSAFGLPSNNLALAYIGETPETAMSRVIVDTAKKQYAATYGVHVIGNGLERLGYVRRYDFLNGNFIAALENDYDETICPYVDNIEYGHLTEIGGVRAIRLSEEADESSVQNTDGLLRDATQYCEGCDEYVHGELEYRVHRYNRRWGEMEHMYVCDCCYESSQSALYLGEEIDVLGDITIEIDDQHYVETNENFAYYGIAWIDRWEEYSSDAVYSELGDESIPHTEAVYLEYCQDYVWEYECSKVEGHMVYKDHIEMYYDEDGLLQYRGLTKEAIHFLDEIFNQEGN